VLHVTVLGAGSWGSALAIAFSRVADKVTLWSHNPQQVLQLSATRSNPCYLPAEITFADHIEFTSDFEQAILSDLLIIATPLNAVRQLLMRLIQYKTDLPDIFVVSKGFEQSSGLLVHQIIEDVLGQNFKRYGLLLGPSFAKEVAVHLPTAITLASPDLKFATSWMHKLIGIPNFRIYAHDDIIGSAVGSAVKNVLAIAVGISDGLELGYNARAALITRSLNELSCLVLALGGRQETIYGLTGIGDLILTCTGDLSRNRQVGQQLAQGKSLKQILADLGHVSEGVLTVEAIYHKAQSLNLSMPIVECVYRILYQHANLYDEVSELIKRQPKSEFSYQ
jgi:glycerol-3-phosphate dehydrogenase (NAD(P)+)